MRRRDRNILRDYGASTPVALIAKRHRLSKRAVWAIIRTHRSRHEAFARLAAELAAS